jgi:GtrA-like protein
MHVPRSIRESDLMFATVAKVFGFGIVSGVGLALDLALFLVFIAVGINPGYANFLSASAAVTFVYFVSTQKVFKYRGQFLFVKFIIYVAYQVFAIAAASWVIAALIVQWKFTPAIAKLAIIPVTFSVNYLVMHVLTSK